jgi:cellulose synthase/poly-beta-1,6-N-acetylglucosamine synthase-like glycosyltransferase
MSDSTAEPVPVVKASPPVLRKGVPLRTPRVNRSRPFRGWRKAVACVPIVLFLVYVVWSHVSWGMSSQIWFLSTFFAFIAVLITYFLISGVFWRSFTHLPPAAGRVIAIVPVYNEEPELVYAVVESLLHQTILPDIIHVVDDGSREPIPPYKDPTGLVHWHRQENGGKREAQANALRRHSPNEFDYILTVDSDSVCDDDALEHMLRAMRDDRVHAATGMVFVRNWSTNFLTRLTDINVITSCLLFRMSRSILGVVSPCSGALALYRAPVVYDNLDDYLENAKIGGGAGDDRRLSFYALLRGQVVGVTEAVVETQLPERWGACFRQRMRWSKSAWLGVGFVMTNLRPLVVFFYVFPLLFALLWPFVVATLITIAVRYHVFTIFNGILFWEVCAVTQTWVYACYRPEFTFRQRMRQYALSPLYPLLGLIILRPAAYWSLTKLKDTSWLTRESSDQALPS